MVNRHFSRLLAVLPFVGLIVATLFPGSIHGQEIREWTDRDGSTIEAAMVGYSFETKEVHWKLPNGSDAKSPLENLSSGNKWTALFEEGGPVQEAFHERWQAVVEQKPMGLLLIALLALLILVAFGLVLEIFCFKMAVRILASPDRDLIAFLKLVLMGFAFSVVIALIFGFITVISGADLSILTFVIQTLGGIGIALMILSGHYQISLMRALGIHVLRSVIVFFVFGFVMVLAALVIYFSGWQFVDPLVLRPLELI